jgi:hypothetical protein
MKCWAFFTVAKSKKKNHQIQWNVESLLLLSKAKKIDQIQLNVESFSMLSKAQKKNLIKFSEMLNLFDRCQRQKILIIKFIQILSLYDLIIVD